MYHKAVFDKLRNTACAELREAETKHRAAVKEARRTRERLSVARAGLVQLMEAEERLNRAAAIYSEGQSIDEATSQRVSEMILACLHHRPSAGATLAELSEMLGDVKRSTISATLYNMKQRGHIEHNETNGKYSLSREVRGLLVPTKPR